MANEISLTGTLAYSDSEGTVESLQTPANLQASVATKQILRTKISAPTTAGAIPLGNVAALGWAMFANRDATNYVELLTGTGGVAFARIYPGCTAGPFYFGSGVTAPYIKANAAPVQVDLLICSQ